jgi:hypothetical protein
MVSLITSPFLPLQHTARRRGKRRHCERQLVGFI